MFRNKKIVGMIPARVDSSRIYKKNLRYLGDKLLIEHIIDTVKQVSFFDEIYINSPDAVFKDIAKEKNISFFDRSVWTGDGIETNDDFTFEFLKKVDCDICLLCNPTSPFLSVDDFYGFLDFMMKDKYDTAFSVFDIKAFCVYEGKHINYDQNTKMLPTEDLTPVSMFVNGIMGWVRSSFLSRMEKYGCASLGTGGYVCYYSLSGDSALDIDWESDFVQAEKILELDSPDKKYYEGEPIV